jgi:hypothetical protein
MLPLNSQTAKSTGMTFRDIGQPLKPWDHPRAVLG